MRLAFSFAAFCTIFPLVASSALHKRSDNKCKLWNGTGAWSTSSTDLEPSQHSVNIIDASWSYDAAPVHRGSRLYRYDYKFILSKDGTTRITSTPLYGAPFQQFRYDVHLGNGQVLQYWSDTAAGCASIQHNFKEADVNHVTVSYEIYKT